MKNISKRQQKRKKQPPEQSKYRPWAENYAIYLQNHAQFQTYVAN